MTTISPGDATGENSVSYVSDLTTQTNDRHRVHNCHSQHTSATPHLDRLWVVGHGLCHLDATAHRAGGAYSR